MLHHQLRAFHTHVFVDRQAINQAGAVAVGLGGEVELDGVEAIVAFAQPQLEVFFLEDALLFDFEFIHEQRCREALAPDFVFQQAGGVQGEEAAFECAVGFQGAGEVGGVEEFAGDLGEELLKALEVIFTQGGSGGHGVAAKADEQTGGAFGDKVEGIAQMQAGDGAARAFDDAAFARSKGKDRAVEFVLDPRGEDADDAFVPAGVEEGNAGGGIVDGHAFEQVQGLFLHVGFDVAAFAVEGIELLGDLQGAGGVVGEQAFDTQAHVGEPPGGVQARAEDEAEIHGRGFARVAPGGFEEGGEAGLHAAGAHPFQALADQDAVIAVEFDNISDGAEGDEVEQVGKVGFGALSKIAALAQFGAQGKHDVEHDADAGDAFGGEVAARLIGIDDAISGGQGFAGQVVVGDQGGDTVLLGTGDAFQAGDAVVDGNDQVRGLLGGKVDDFWREAIAELETIRQQEVDVRAQ